MSSDSSDNLTPSKAARGPGNPVASANRMFDPAGPNSDGAALRPAAVTTPDGLATGLHMRALPGDPGPPVIVNIAKTASPLPAVPGYEILDDWAAAAWASSTRRGMSS